MSDFAVQPCVMITLLQQDSRAPFTHSLGRRVVGTGCEFLEIREEAWAYVLVRVLQRNRTNGAGPVCVKKFIKELASE